MSGPTLRAVDNHEINEDPADFWNDCQLSGNASGTSVSETVSENSLNCVPIWVAKSLINGSPVDLV